MLPTSESKPPTSRRRKRDETHRPTVSRPELLVNGSDREFRTFLHGMLSFASRMESIRDGFARLIGLTGIQYTILISIRYLEAEGEVTVGTVAAHLHLSGAFVTIETGKLAERGLLKKRQDSKDRRRVCLSVTKKGDELLKELLPVQTRVNDALFEFLDEEQFRTMYEQTGPMAACGDRALSLLHYLASGQAPAHAGKSRRTR